MRRTRKRAVLRRSSSKFEKHSGGYGYNAKKGIPKPAKRSFKRRGD